MSTAEASELERAVSEDEDFDDDGDSEELDDGTDGRNAHVNQTQTAPLVGYPNASAAPVHAPDPIRSVDPAAAPLNGAIPIQVVSFPAASSGSPLFTASPTIPIPVYSADISRPLTVVTFDESRRLFQRLWTDEEEIKILQGFLEFTSRRGTTFASHQYDTGPFYEEIKKELHFEFTKNQLIEKLRRLKKKYRNCVNRMRSAGKDFAFRSAHERAIYDIARNIWSAIAKRAQESDGEDLNNPKSTLSNEIFTVPVNEGSFGSDRRMPRSRRRGGGIAPEETVVAPVGGAVAENTAPVNVMAAPVVSSVSTPTPSAIEATVKSCLSPLFKELINSAIGGPFAPGFGGTSPLNLFPMSLGGSSLVGSAVPVDDQWRRQQILELEVYLKRIELVTDHVKSMLEELKSSSS
ncbi:probable transcription factor At5g28040 [Zingiber officinale]|uniref:probable transcription factor At5g28040 n=1 Tax=Zingiber officinale TaxID=94328 RepID=UPI001C4CB555|nr:probable transcription factor At5g28040 [Zingiber officinale]XP_042398253.1 probable transcription factor At5g28040 [Zingiber officinale]